jgi:hypothetical protein
MFAGIEPDALSICAADAAGHSPDRPGAGAIDAPSAA